LLDLGLPDSQGLETVITVRTRFPVLPIVVMSGLQDETTALESLTSGAQDYLLKGMITSGVLSRVLRHAIERQRLRMELAASEGRTRRIIEVNPDGVVVVDRQGIIRFANPAAHLLFGRSGNDLLGHPMDLSQGAGATAELTIPRPEGAPLTVELRSVPSDWDGRPSVIIFLHDITGRKQAEETARQARENEERIQQLETELRTLAGLSSAPRTGVTARMYGVMTLVEGFPETFRTLVAGYQELIELALEQQTFKVKHDISGRLGAMAETLGFYKAGPQDVVDIHVTALTEKTRHATTFEKRKAYTGEGWVLVLELMGHLVSYYRTRTLGSGAPAPHNITTDTTSEEKPHG
jgi:PAS domain-containing protein